MNLRERMGLGRGAAIKSEVAIRPTPQPRQPSVDRAYQDLKLRIHRELVERIDLDNLGRLDLDRANAELRSVIGQLIEYRELIHHGTTLASDAYGSVFYLTTGFHGMHVTGGLIAFLLVLGRTYAAKRWTHEQATSAIVVSYYWHFVDVVWIGLFATIYLIR